MDIDIIYNKDCLVGMKRLNNEIMDLIYIDPPFCTQKNRGYKDTWKWNEEAEIYYNDIKHYKVIEAFKILLGKNGLFAYLVYMYIRIKEMHRLLVGDGSIYVHCDWRVNSYLRLILDDIFGKENFRNEIVWFYRTGGASKNNFAKKHDIILFYTKSMQNIFNLQYVPYVMEGIKKDEKGLYKMQAGKRLIFNSEGALMPDVWEISYISSMSSERLNFPNQKPERLLERIIRVSSIEGDLIADFFCGSGTTCAVAKKLGRHYIGYEINKEYYKIAKARLEAEKTLWD